MTRLQGLFLVLVLHGPFVSAKNISGETARLKRMLSNQSTDGASNVGDLSGCTDAVRAVKVPITSRISDLQKELSTSVALLKVELTAVRKTQEDLKTALLAIAKSQPQPDAQKALANATKERREITLSSLKILLGYNNATNVSAEAVLSEIGDCAETKKIANLYGLEKEFRSVTTRDLDVASSGEHIGAFPLRACGVKCLLRGNSCRGFHVSAADRCTLFTAATASWSETETAEATVWVRRCGCTVPKCNEVNFPHSRGRSRYRVFTDGKNWAAAGRRCQELGAKLVQISSEPERLFVNQMMRKYDANAYFHVGLYQSPIALEPNGGWLWFPSRDRFDLHSRWAAGQPDDNSRANRVCLYSKDGLFYDEIEISAFYSVCECLLV